MDGYGFVVILLNGGYEGAVPRPSCEYRGVFATRGGARAAGRRVAQRAGMPRGRFRVHTHAEVLVGNLVVRPGRAA